MQTKDETNVVKPKRGTRRRLWRAALPVLIVLPFVPEITLYVVAALTTHCPLDQKNVCNVGWWSASELIDGALRAGSPLLFKYFIATSPSTPLPFDIDMAFAAMLTAWLVICYAVLLAGWQRTSSRVLIGLAIALIFAVLPYIGPRVALGHFSNPHCQPSEGGGSCMIFGRDLSESANYVAVQPWLAFYGIPAAGVVFLIYLVVVLLIRSPAASKGRATTVG